MIKIHDKHFTPFLLEKEISLRIRELANELDTAFTSERPLFIVVLNGAFMFASDLLRELNTTVEVHFIKLSSYHGTSSTGTINCELDLSQDITGREVYIIEDIIETGNTIDYIKELCRVKEVATTKVVSLLYKSLAASNIEAPDYYCFDIANDFVVGYGLDYDQLGRQLKDIWVLKE